MPMNASFKQLAVIGGQDQIGIIQEPFPPQRLEQTPKFRIGVSHKLIIEALQVVQILG